MTHPSIEISIDDQSLTWISPSGNRKTWPISSAARGIGHDDGSWRTPTGSFEILERIGENAAPNTIYRARRPVDIWDEAASDEDLILCRILRLRGLEDSNRNTETRWIYIHGTNHEATLGSPASQGCIRMSRADVMELFDLTPDGCPVRILPPTQCREPLIFFDCDSTLASIEGIDELAHVAGPPVFQQVKELTDAAMNGEVPLDEVFRKRMSLISPTRELADQVARRYIETITPGARELVAQLRDVGWTIAILSGGFEPLIRPLARELGISHVEAVPLHFHDDGSYAGYGDTYPTTRNGGKPEIIQAWQHAIQPRHTVMVGDGISDLETAAVCDLFIGYGGVVSRTQVRTQADLWVENFEQITPATIDRALTGRK